MLNIEFHANALAEFKQATIWYNNQRKGLGKEFFEEVNSSIDLISKNPDIWPKYLKYLHRLILKRFPYNIVYRVKPDAIEIIAIAHQKKKPGYWQYRV